jgi:NAD(P)-dependent dehydrogenase (short-subunit alcohol dehydrogenase family)
MQVSLEGRVALVTGASRGIGRAIALSLAEAGADIALNYRRDHEAAAEVVADVEKLGRKAKAYSCAVENFDDDKAMVEQIVSDFGSIGILINNAGIASRGNTVVDTDPLEMERVVRVHAFGSHYMSKLCIPHLRKAPRSDVIMISSVATIAMSANGGPYNMAKGAIEALALTLAKEERAHGVRVNIVAPGLTVTEMGARLAKATRSVADIHELDATSPFGRVSEPGDVAAMVTFLVSSANPYVSGQKIYINGGG